jgi:uncharacterized protein YlxW (UPF0749 family)
MKMKVQLTISLVALLVGLFIAVQFRSATEMEGALPDLRVTEMRSVLMETISQNQLLTRDLEEMRERVQQYEQAALKGESSMQVIQSELENARLLAGLVAVEGPGLVITLSDSQAVSRPGDNPNVYLVHDEDLLKLVNVLSAAGAEAISINEQRLLATSEIHCAGPTISINNVRVGAPFVIKVIGNPETLDSSLHIREGVVETLSYFGIGISVKREDTIRVPAYKRPVRFDYAKPVTGGNQ